MQISRLARIAAATAAAITVIGVSGFGTAEAGTVASAGAHASSAQGHVPRDNFTGVRTYDCSIRGCIILQSFNCTPTSHFGITNPIYLVVNKCPTVTFLEGYQLSQRFCVGVNSSRTFANQFTVRDIHITISRTSC